ncbi:MAG: ATP-binding protein, partial [Acidobacteriota bacterium]
PIPFLVMLILVAVYLLLFVGRQMLAPLGRMMEATRRIAEGDFTPITPQRKYHDEFTDLAMALNHMMHQLVQRQDLLVRAHKLKAVGTLTAGVAHELNNPINNIMVTACLLEEDYEDYSEEERIDMIQDLVSESERAQGIVRNLLDFARETDPDIEPLDIQQLVEEVLRLASNQIKLARVKVRGEVESQLPPVFGDAQQLKQVFLNHVLNAVDAMPDGGTLSINVEKGKNRDFLMVEIADTGTGIPQHQLNNIFDPFFTTKSKSKGTGLGLAVSLSIVKKHGGDISVRSKVGRGTTFTVILPAAKVPADLTAAGS